MNRTEVAPRGGRLVLALLLVAYIFNFLDRQILGILAGSIIKDLDLTDAIIDGLKASFPSLG